MDPTLRVCTHLRSLGGGPSCGGRGSQTLMAELVRVTAQNGSGWKVAQSTCLGHCHNGPNVKGAPGGPILNHCTTALSVIERMNAAWPNGLDL